MTSAPSDDALYRAMLDDHRVALETLGGWFASGPGCHVAGFPAVPIELLNGIWVDPHGGDRSVGAFSELLDDLAHRGATPYVITLGPASPAVEAEALRLGLTAVESLPMMLVMPAWLTPLPDTGAMFTRETEPGVACGILAEGFEIARNQAASMLSEALLACEEVDVYLAWAGRTPTSTATTLVAGEGGGVYMVATPPAHRGHGYGGAVTAHAVREAFGRGAAFAYLQASAMGHPVYRRLGFQERFRFTVFGRSVAV